MFVKISLKKGKHDSSSVYTLAIHVSINPLLSGLKLKWTILTMATAVPGDERVKGAAMHLSGFPARASVQNKYRNKNITNYLFSIPVKSLKLIFNSSNSALTRGHVT